MNRILPAIGLCSLGLLFSSATFAQESSANRVAQPGGSRTENRIAREVRHELVMLPNYGVFDNFEFKVDGSTVTLMGEVTRPTLKSEAENVTKNVEGVEKVVNTIKVFAPGDKGWKNVGSDSFVIRSGGGEG
jgi:hyperosmotically inducible protein